MTSKQRCDLEGRCAEIEQELQQITDGSTGAVRRGHTRRQAELLRELDRLEYELGLDDGGRHPRSHRRRRRPAAPPDDYAY